MTETKKYKFIGENGTHGLRKNARYNLKVTRLSIVERVWMHLPLHWAVVAYRPGKPREKVLGYVTRRRFNKEWQEA